MSEPLQAAPPAEPEPPPRTDRLVAVTVRLDSHRYECLKRFGLQRRLTNQRILVRALDRLMAQG